jgi:DNA-binding NarL/FixJ family response regulator
MANKIEVDALSGETVITELTDKEVAESQKEYLAIEATKKAEQEAKLAARESALAKLAAIGLTEEEIRAL